jgi:predicted metalloprotease
MVRCHDKTSVTTPEFGENSSVRWKRGRGRDQIEDRRGQGVGGLGGGAGGLPLPLPKVGGGLGVLLVVALIVLFSTGVLGGSGGSGQAGQLSGAPDAQKDLVEFVGFVVDDVQNFWERDFASDGRTYQQTKLVLFDGATQSGCGLASSETGPFYCPADQKVYLDLGFFRELQNQLGAGGDFAQAYVIAHEFGHHVQTLLGTEERVTREQQSHPSEANELSIRLELQADCYAGAWAHSAFEQNELESGDLEEAISAAEAVGDDRIQRSAGTRVNPETWTHGSSAQRVKWLKIGFQDGDTAACDTFSGSI